ncbi:MAG: flotillin-like FloA family protein, partial [Gemmatimonadales bacterium]
MDDSLSLGLVLALFFIAFIFAVIFFRFIPIGLWIRAAASGVRVSFLTLFGMRFRKVSPAAIVDPLITARKAGLDLTIDQLEIHYLSGGNVQ